MKEKIIVANQTSFFFSSQTKDNRFQELEDFFKWFEIRKGNLFSINKIPFNKLDQWHFTEHNSSLVHNSGKFFSIEGIRVSTNFGKQMKWEQPIINQPEIGILGVLTKVIDGIRYFLMQAKMEPGNINILQLSPTVQATKSNFSQVHQGKLPDYLEYFIDSSKSKVLIDQLQTEQGARFLRKRNRNMVVEVYNEIEILNDFCWLTLGEIKQLLRIDNFVNMDARSVISTIPMIDDSIIQKTKNINWDETTELTIEKYTFKGINLGMIYSACSEEVGQNTKDEIISWYTEMKVQNELIVEQIPLSTLDCWKINGSSIYNNSRFFSVIAVKVHAGTREVTSWTQPLIKDDHIGLLGFIVQRINNVLHFLVQAKVEAGNIDIIELSPSLSCSNYNYLVDHIEKRPPFFEYFLKESQVDILIDTIQSEEGGRFYQMQNRNMIVMLDDAITLSIPKNYIWMTLNQMMDFMRYSMFNIEARSLISCLDFNQ